VGQASLACGGAGQCPLGRARVACASSAAQLYMRPAVVEAAATTVLPAGAAPAMLARGTLQAL